MNALDLGYAAAAVVTAPWWLRKARGGWPERLARVLPDLPPKAPGRSRIMIHAVSVGEINAVRGLVPALASEAEVVVTAGTDTGFARAGELFAGCATVARYPLDASWVVRRFLRRVDPDVVGLVELEIWPNFVRACRERGVPVAVINGRLSERSLRGYHRVRRWMSPSFAALAVAAVQDEAYAERFLAMGVPRGRIVVTGSMKFDSARIEDEVEGADSLARELGIDPSRPLIVAGSTGPGEEALLLGAVREAFEPGAVQLLCAPRKPERFDEAAAALPGCTRRSARSPGAGGDLFLLDTLGELRMAYSLADLVVVGRSFFDLHGSDPIEPVALGKATIIGPAVSDFATIVEQLESVNGLARADRSSLSDALRTLLADQATRREMAIRGRERLRSLSGATARHAELLLGLVPENRPEQGREALRTPANAAERRGGALPSTTTRA